MKNELVKHIIAFHALIIVGKGRRLSVYSVLLFIFDLKRVLSCAPPYSVIIDTCQTLNF